MATQTQLGKSVLPRFPQNAASDEGEGSISPRGSNDSNVELQDVGEGDVVKSDLATDVTEYKVTEHKVATNQMPVRAREEPSPEHSQRLGVLLASVKEAMTDRDLERASTHLSKAQKLPARPEDMAKLQRLVVLHDYVTKYWNAMDSELKRIESGNEIQIKDARVIVVEKTDRELTIRAAGRNRIYPIDKLPLALAIALAERWLRPTEPSTHVFRAAMMATMPDRYSAEDAKSEWQKARLAGGIELGDLELVLEDSYELSP